MIAVITDIKKNMTSWYFILENKLANLDVAWETDFNIRDLNKLLYTVVSLELTSDKTMTIWLGTDETSETLTAHLSNMSMLLILMTICAKVNHHHRSSSSFIFCFVFIRHFIKNLPPIHREGDVAEHTKGDKQQTWWLLFKIYELI